jgi:hypothetical protein
MSPNPAPLPDGDRRRKPRRDTDLLLEIRLDPKTLAGRAENVSTGGVFFFVHEPVEVTVTFLEDGQRKSHTGRLVRAERLSAETTGFAVEFPQE